MIQSVRLVRHPDGMTEVIRVLSEAELEGWRPEEPLSYEASIVWLYDPETLDFARVTWVQDAASRHGRLRLPAPAITLGYSRLTVNAPRNRQTLGFTRRVFYLLPEDCNRNLIDYPPGAIDPVRLAPGHHGEPPDCGRIRPTYLGAAFTPRRPAGLSQQGTATA
ncbi:MAG: hypothetical protein KatS3mg110_0739 [Pirellulaceae bacterium]|nr:MAG: hypothetical protein KatS3mg110_0739 [Pirellulaceae bacterium]